METTTTAAASESPRLGQLVRVRNAYATVFARVGAARVQVKYLATGRKEVVLLNELCIARLS